VPAAYGLARIPEGLSAQDAGALGLAGTDVQVVDYTADLNAQVRAIAPDGVDVILHLASDGVELAALLGTGGRIASTLGLTPDAVGSRDVTVHPIMADPSGQTLTVLAQQAASGALRVPVTATYPLEQAHEAFAAFSEGTLGKIAVTCS